MKTNRLGRTDIEVSEICLGTMTWGSQNSEDEAHAQMSRALERGVNFFDTAEMYPTTPTSADTVGLTEAIVGSWFEASGQRDKVVLGTKILGEGNALARNGAPVTPATIRDALHGSLERLRTDYVDLYQIHWPNRGSYHFRKHWSYDPSDQDPAAEIGHFEEVLQELQALQQEGKIRSFGMSNDTAWGIMRLTRLAEERDLPRVASIQNEYSLLNRMFDTDLGEIALHEDVGLLAYSPLACGMLTGKYDHGMRPAGSRMTISGKEDLGGRWVPEAVDAMERYNSLARQHGLDPAKMALAFCLSRPFMTSVIIGATDMVQLDTAIDAADVTLDEHVLNSIDVIRRRHGLPF